MDSENTAHLCCAPGILSKFSFILACLSGTDGRRLAKGKLGFRWVVPDGGWGWVVAFGAAAINVFYTAGSLVFGIIYNDLLEYMETTGSVAGWVIGLYYFTNNVAGPLVLSFAVRYTYRLASIVGAILAFIGFFLSAFANSIEIMFITYGILAGLGIAFALSTSLCVVYPYFDKRKGIATSISLTGFPVGRFIMAPLLQFLHQQYGLKGVLLIVAALVLNIAVCGMLFHPVANHMKLVIDDDSSPPSPLIEKPLAKEHNMEEIAEENEYENGVHTNSNGHSQGLPKVSSVTEMQKFIKERRQSTTSHTSIRSAIMCSVPEMSSTFAVNMKAASTVNQDLDELEENSVDDRRKTQSWFGRVKATLFGGIQFSILLNPVFYIIVLNAFMSVSLVSYVYIFLVPLGQAKGLTDMEVNIMMIATASGECLGRMGLPAFMDLKLVPGKYIIIVTAGISGTLLWALVLTKSFIPTTIVCTCLGFVSGGHVGGSFFVIVEVLGVAMMPSSTGLTQFFQAFYSLLVGPIIGKAKDVTGTFNTCYLIVSGISYLTMIGWLLLPLAQKSNRHREERKNKKITS